MRFQSNIPESYPRPRPIVLDIPRDSAGRFAPKDDDLMQEYYEKQYRTQRLALEQMVKASAPEASQSQSGSLLQAYLAPRYEVKKKQLGANP